VSDRTFRRWTRRYEEEGEAGLLDRRLGQASGKRVPVDRAEEVERLYRERYQGFTVKHFHEHLVKDHGLGWGYTWLKLHLQWAGVVPKAVPRKGAQRRKRERRPLRGMMLHQDGSRHAWLEGETPLDLIVTLDDATGAIYSAFLIEEEGTASTFRALNEVFGEHGLPMSLYTDRGSHYFRTTKAGAIDRGCPTQVGRALAQLGSSTSEPIRRRPGGDRAGIRDASGPAAEGTQARGRHRHRGSQRFHPRGLSPASPSIRPARARPSRPFRASTSMRPCASRRSARSAMTIASPTGG
jgi:transposase